MNKHVVLILLFVVFACPEDFAQQLPGLVGLKRARLADTVTALSNIRWRMDSLAIERWSDSSTYRIGQQFNTLELELSRKIDSLKLQQGGSPALNALSDSLNKRKERLISGVEKSRAALLEKTKSRIEKWKSSVKSKLGLDSLSTALTLPLGENEVLDKLGIPETDPGQWELPGIPSVTATDFQHVDLSGDLSSINESLSFDKLDGLKEIQEKLDPHTQELSQVKTLTQNPDQTLETSLQEIDQVKQVREQLDVAGDMENNDFIKSARQLENPAAFGEESKQQVVSQAMNHFAGKEKILQQAIEKMAKYKDRYNSISSFAELSKHRLNEMRGKSLIERMLPGIALQIQKEGDNLLVDFNLYLGYRFTGKLTAGLGWNQRVAYDLNNNSFSAGDRVYGPRAFGEFKVWKGFSPRVELEIMKTFVPPFTNIPTLDIGRREWVWGAFVGLKKEYTIVKAVKGTAMIMTRLFDPHHKSPYTEVINARIGFEFPIKTKRGNDSIRKRQNNK